MLIKLNKIFGNMFPVPAVANTIFNTVGVRVRNLPITPEKVLNKIANNH